MRKFILTVLLSLLTSPVFAGEVIWLTGLEEYDYEELLLNIGNYPIANHSTADLAAAAYVSAADMSADINLNRNSTGRQT